MGIIDSSNVVKLLNQWVTALSISLLGSNPDSPSISHSKTSLATSIPDHLSISLKNIKVLPN